MDHWRSRYVNRVLPRTLYLAVRWADVAELWSAYKVVQALARLRFLLAIDVDFARLDRDQGHAQALRRRPRQPPPRVLQAPPPPPLELERGVWV